MNNGGAQFYTEPHSITCSFTAVNTIDPDDTTKVSGKNLFHVGRDLNKSVPLEVMFDHSYATQPIIVPGVSQFEYDKDDATYVRALRLTVFDYVMDGTWFVGARLAPCLDGLDPSLLPTSLPADDGIRFYEWFDCQVNFLVTGLGTEPRNVDYGALTYDLPSEIYSPDNVEPNEVLSIRVTVGMEDDVAYAAVDWDPVLGAKSYETVLCLDGDQLPNSTADGTTLSWDTLGYSIPSELPSVLFTPLVVQMYYWVRVRAIGTKLVGRWYYQRFLVDVVATQLGAPQNVSVIPLEYLTLRLSWDPPTNALTVPVDLYVICRSEDGNPDYVTGWKKIAVTNDNTRSYTDLPTNIDPLSTNKTFYYYVYAVSKWMVVGIRSAIVHATVAGLPDYSQQAADLSTALGTLDGAKIANASIIGTKLAAASVDLASTAITGTLNAAKITGGLLQAYGGSFASRMVSTTFVFAKSKVTDTPPADCIAITWGTISLRVATVATNGSLTWNTTVFTPPAGTWKDINGANTIITSATYTVPAGNSRYGYVSFASDASGEPITPSELRWATNYPTGLYDIMLVWVTETASGLGIEPIYTKGGTVISGDHIATGSIQAENIGAKAITAEKINANAILAYTADFVNRLRSCDVTFKTTPETGANPLGVVGCEWVTGTLKLNGYVYTGTDAINQATFGAVNVTINSGTIVLNTTGMPTCNSGTPIAKGFLYVTYLPTSGEPATGQTLTVQHADTYPEGLHAVILALYGFQYHADTGKISGIVTPTTPTGTTIDGDHISTGSIKASDIRTGILRGWQGTGNYFDLNNGKIYLTTGNSLDDQLTNITPTWDHITNRPGFIGATAPSSGLYLSSTGLGYINAGVWKTYMDNTGNFYLGGSNGVGSALTWNGSALTISSTQMTNMVGATTTAQTTAGNAGTAASNAQTAAGNAASAASTAQGSANTANQAIFDISNDNILSSVEKKAVIVNVNGINNEYNGILAQADAFVITTSERSNYVSAVTNLNNYLAGLTGWNVVPGSNVSINGTTFKAYFTAVYSSRQVLLNKIASQAKVLAEATAIANDATTLNAAKLAITTFHGTVDVTGYTFPTGHPRAGDLYVRHYDNSGTTETETNWVYNGTIWVVNTTFILGSHITTGSITASQIDIDNLSANWNASSGTTAHMNLKAAGSEYGQIIFSGIGGYFSSYTGPNAAALKVVATGLNGTNGVLGLAGTAGINLYAGSGAIRIYSALNLVKEHGVHWVDYNADGTPMAGHDSYLTSDGVDIVFHKFNGNYVVLGSSVAKFA